MSVFCIIPLLILRISLSNYITVVADCKAELRERQLLAAGCDVVKRYLNGVGIAVVASDFGLHVRGVRNVFENNVLHFKVFGFFVVNLYKNGSAFVAENFDIFKQNTVDTAVGLFCHNYKRTDTIVIPDTVSVNNGTITEGNIGDKLIDFTRDAEASCITAPGDAVCKGDVFTAHNAAECFDFKCIVRNSCKTIIHGYVMAVADGKTVAVAAVADDINLINVNIGAAVGNERPFGGIDNFNVADIDIVAVCENHAAAFTSVKTGQVNDTSAGKGNVVAIVEV